MRGLAKFAFLIIFPLLFSLPAVALESVKTELTRFNAPGAVQIDGDGGEYTIKIPIPQRWLVNKATLQLSYVNSELLLASRSQMIILLNGVPTAQVKLFSEAPAGLVTVSLPTALLTPGYNDLTVKIAQNYKEEGCIPKNSPGVWTCLKLSDSSLNIQYDLKEVPLLLSEAGDFLFDPRQHEDNAVHIVIQEYSPRLLELATLAAAGVALRFDYRPVHFSLSTKLQGGVDNVVVGSTELVDKMLSGYGIETRGNHLGLAYLPRTDGVASSGDGPDRYHALLYIVGNDLDTLARNVEAFSLLSSSLPATPGCTITDVRLPQITKASGKNVVIPGKEYSFAELDWKTTTFRGEKSTPSAVSITLPSDLFLEENRTMDLSLNLAYAAKMRDDSSLSMDINNHFVASIPLENSSGGLFQGYRVRVPLTYLKPGRNTLSIRAILTPLHTGRCEEDQTANLAVTVFADSKLLMPNVPRYTDMPHLEDILDTGFPLTSTPDFAETTIMLPAFDPDAVNAMVNLVGMLCQRTGVPPLQLHIDQKTVTRPSTNLLVLGALAALPPDLAEASPVVPAIRMAMHGRLPGTLQQKSWKDRLSELLTAEDIFIKRYQPDTAAIGTPLIIGHNKMLLCEYESPYAAMRSVVMVTADSGPDLLAGTLSLINPNVQHQVAEGISLIDFQSPKPKVSNSLLTATYQTGEYTAVNLLSYLVSKAGWFYYLLLLALLGVLALLFTVLVKRRNKKRLAQQSESVNDEATP